MSAMSRAILAFGLVAVLGGCAVGRSVVPLDQVQAIQNPASGIAVKIKSVEDARVFEAAPKDPSTPSLQDGEIGNSAITARAIARKRGGFGKALGDILLPEGQTVAAVMQDSIGNGFRKAGYRVLQPGDQGYEQAVAVDAWVRQYWTWVNFGFWALTVHCRAEVDLKEIYRLSAAGSPSPQRFPRICRRYSRRTGCESPPRDGIGFPRMWRKRLRISRSPVRRHFIPTPAQRSATC